MSLTICLNCYLLYNTLEKSKSLIVKPQQLETIIGFKSEFVCVSNNPVQWLFENKALPDNAVTSRIPRTDKYVLEIYDVQLSNAGTYSCYSEVNNEIIFSEGVLHVIGKNIETNEYSLSNETFILCNWHFVFSWIIIFKCLGKFEN